MRENSYLFGQLLLDNSLENLESVFLKYNLRCEIRLSSHFHDGKYLRITLNSDTELTFEKISNNEFLIKGESNNQSELLLLAENVSAILSNRELKHRIEMYDTNEIEFAYYNYDWTR